MTGQPRRVTAEARTEALVAAIPLAAIHRLTDPQPEWWRHFLPLAVQFGDIDAMMAADLSLLGIERRCMAALWRLGGVRVAGPRDGAPVQPPITQKEPAAASNLSRNVVGEMRRPLVTAGLVASNHGGITILDGGRLRSQVSGT